MKTQFDGSADLMMNMAGTFLILLALLLPLAQLKHEAERLTLIEQQQSQEREPSPEQDVMETALVEVSLAEDGQTPTYMWQESTESERTQIAEYDALREALRISRPDAIRLRIDRQVPSGVMQDLVTDASSLGIAILQSSRKPD